MKRLSIISSLVLIFSIVTITSAQARWGGGYYACKKTPLIEFDGTITDAVIANPLVGDGIDLSILLDAVLATIPEGEETSDVLEALSNPNANWTVFAPVNEAFEAIPGPVLGEVLADPELVSAVLLYHVVDGYFDPRRVFYIRKKGTVLGQSLFVSRGSSKPSVNQSKVECQGVKTNNGVVWLVDGVFQPQY